MCLSWIIYLNKNIKYENEEKNTDWLNKSTWYNTNICSKFNGTLFEDFIRNSRPDIYNLMCYITVHDRQQPTHVYYARSAVGRAIPRNETTTALKSLDATLKFIDCWLQHFQKNYH